MTPVDGLVLAAGASRRLGRPKPLEPTPGGGTWLTHSVDALRPHVRRVWVAIGHEAERVRAAHPGLDVEWTVAERWDRGMGATLAHAVGAVAATDAEALAIVPCDLPELDAALVGRLIAAAGEDGRSAAACGYDGVVGIPVCIRRAWFGRFSRLSGDRGAHARLREGDPGIAVVDWPGGGRDRDRPL